MTINCSWKLFGKPQLAFGQDLDTLDNLKKALIGERVDGPLCAIFWFFGKLKPA